MLRFSPITFIILFLSLLVKATTIHAEEKIECTFQVKKGWPEYKLVLLDKVDNKSYQYSIYTGDNIKLQDLPEPPPEENINSTWWGENYLTFSQKFYQRPHCGFVDMNFDGYLDIKALGNCGSACMLYFWLFNPKSKKFEYSFSSNSYPEPIPKEKVIYSVGRNGSVYHITKARWKNNKLLFFYSEELKPYVVLPNEALDEDLANFKVEDGTYTKYVKVRKDEKWIKLPPKVVKLSENDLPKSNGW